MYFADAISPVIQYNHNVLDLLQAFTPYHDVVCACWVTVALKTKNAKNNFKNFKKLLEYAIETAFP